MFELLFKVITLEYNGKLPAITLSRMLIDNATILYVKNEAENSGLIFSPRTWLLQLCTHTTNTETNIAIPLQIIETP